MPEIDDVATIVFANKWANVRELDDSTFFKSIRLRMNDKEITQPYRQHVWTHACVKSIATTIASVPFLIVRDKKTSDRSKSRVPKLMDTIRAINSEHRQEFGQAMLRASDFEIMDGGPVYSTFHDVNPLMTKAQLWEATTVLLAMDGDAFWLLQGSDGKPISAATEWPARIWPMGQKKILPYVKDGAIEGWRYDSDAQDHKRFELFQVLWFYDYNPYDPLDGLGDYETVKEAASQDHKSAKYNEAFFDNGAEPGGILTVPGDPNDTQRKDILRAWNDRHKGPEKQGKTALLTHGAKYDRNPRTHQDMQFLEGRKWNRDETFAGFRTPKILASIYEDINMATAFAAIKQFWNQVAIPRMVYYEDSINSKMMKKPDARDWYVMFDLSNVEALRADEEKKSQVAERYSKIGIPTEDIIDQMELKFPKRGWMGSWWVPFNLVPISDKESESTENPAQGGDGNDNNADMIRKIDRASKGLKRQIDKGKQWQAWVNNVLSPIEGPYQEKIHSFWYELRKEQIAKWEQSTKDMPSEGELNSILFDRDVWGAKLGQISLPFYEEASRLALEQTSQELNTDPWNLNDPRVQAQIELKKNKIRIVTDEFWMALRDNIVEGMQENETVTEISTRIRKQFNNAQKPYATLRIARTETAQISGMVRHANLEGEGIKKKEWNTAGDEDVREAHKIFGSLGPVPIGHNYMTDIGQSGKLMYPNDPEGPADQVINCRCVELPVI